MIRVNIRVGSGESDLHTVVYRPSDRIDPNSFCQTVISRDNR
ncbi:hypothetical protein [Stieleria maiorica]|nr:hypothetical protein [Stieleria maiorica]